MKRRLRYCTVSLGLLLGNGPTLLFAADPAEAQLPHTYVFDQPELLSAQRVFGVANATIMLGNACHAFPAATAAYETWLTENQSTLQTLTATLAVHYRVALGTPDQRVRVAQAMHLKTSLDLPPAALDEACPTLADTLSLPHMNLQQRYRDTLTEVRDPNYLKLKNKPVRPASATDVKTTKATTSDAETAMEQTP